MERWVVKVEGNIVYFAATARQRADEYAADCRRNGKLAYVLSEAAYRGVDRGGRAYDTLWCALSDRYVRILEEGESND